MKQTRKILVSLALIAVTATALSAVTGGPFLLFAGALLALGAVKGLITPAATPTNLAYTGLVISDTTYAGEVASQFIVKAITGNETVEGGHIYVKDGIKKKFTIPRFDADYEDLIQDRAATPTSAGDLNVDGKALNPADYMIYVEFNPRDFEDHWYAMQTGNMLLDAALPATFESVLIQEVMKRHGKYINKAIWNNSTALAAPSIYRYYDGLIKKAVDSSDTIDVTTPTTLSAANILAEMAETFGLIPDTLKYDPNMKLFMNYKSYSFYEEAQIAQTYKGVDPTRAGVPTYRGLPVVRIADMPDDTMFVAKGMATTESNLWMGINSMDDNSIQLQRLQPNSELYFIKLLMKADVQIGWNEETVLYKA